MPMKPIPCSLQNGEVLHYGAEQRVTAKATEFDTWFQKGQQAVSAAFPCLRSRPVFGSPQSLDPVYHAQPSGCSPCSAILEPSATTIRRIVLHALVADLPLHAPAAGERRWAQRQVAPLCRRRGSICG